MKFKRVSLLRLSCSCYLLTQRWHQLQFRFEWLQWRSLWSLALCFLVEWEPYSLLHAVWFQVLQTRDDLVHWRVNVDRLFLLPLTLGQAGFDFIHDWREVVRVLAVDDVYDELSITLSQWIIGEILQQRGVRFDHLHQLLFRCPIIMRNDDWLNFPLVQSLLLSS